MTTNMTFTQLDIALGAPSRLRAGYSQLSGAKSALGTAVRTHDATGFGADVRIARDVPGVLPRGVPV